MFVFPIPEDEPVCVNCNDEGCDYCAPADEGSDFDVVIRPSDTAGGQAALEEFYF